MIIYLRHKGERLGILFRDVLRLCWVGFGSGSSLLPSGINYVICMDLHLYLIEEFQFYLFIV